METFIKANVEAMGKKMEDYDLPSDLDKLIETTKNSITTQKDPRIQKLCREMSASPEGAIMKEALEYLAENRYDVNIETLKQMIVG